MKATDVIKALGVALATLIITLAASFPMVAFYAYVIEPGHSAEFYEEAAQWIAPWSSHILGPCAFLGFNYWMARRAPERNAMLFATATIVLYLLIDLSMLPLMGLPVTAAFTLEIGLSLLVKTAAALGGAHIASRKHPPAGSSPPPA